MQFAHPKVGFYKRKQEITNINQEKKFKKNDNGREKKKHADGQESKN